MKILFSGFRDKNHSQYGGYDHVVRFSNESYFLDAANVPFNFIPFDKRGKRINIYFLDLFSRLLRNKYDILHIFYGDVQIFFPYRKLLKNKIVATIHRSIESLTLRKINILRKFDSVIILSTEQCLKFRNLGINAKFIPHGFNTPNYNYNLPLNHGNKINLEKINIFFSGHHYRDFNMLYFFLQIQNLPDLWLQGNLYILLKIFQLDNILTNLIRVLP
ncbi:hypothetical protein FACS1894137_09350 [Spirochaetia bacterium]|nr:hypothetical protein FACS1894137_09350 [Spirochaetia bacterium]